MTPLELLYEKPGLPSFGLPAPLATAYGGELGIDSPRVYANFVTSMDGIVALGGEVESGGIVSGHSEAEGAAAQDALPRPAPHVRDGAAAPGVDVHRVQRLMRHSDVRVTTGTHSHLLVEDLRAATPTVR